MRCICLGHHITSALDLVACYIVTECGPEEHFAWPSWSPTSIHFSYCKISCKLLEPKCPTRFQLYSYLVIFPIYGWKDEIGANHFLILSRVHSDGNTYQRHLFCNTKKSVQCLSGYSSVCLFRFFLGRRKVSKATVGSCQTVIWDSYPLKPPSSPSTLPVGACHHMVLRPAAGSEFILH